jgi:hypothetical protein
LVGRQRQGNTFRGFVFRNMSSFRSLEVDFPGASFTSAYGINDAGRIVGTYVSPDCPYGCGFLATPQATVPPQCDQTVTLTYSGSTLTLGFTLRTAAPATWKVLLAVQNVPLQLWSISVPALGAPGSLSVPIPNVPKLGTVYALSTLATSAAGIVCADVASVNTGTP